MVITVTSSGKNSPCFLSVYGMLRKEALGVLANLIQLMAEKLKEPISHLRGWVNGRILITVVRSYSHMIREDILTSPLWE